MVLKWLAVYGAVQMVLESIAAYGTVERVLKSIAAYGNLHFAGMRVKVDWPHMFPCSAVLFTLCFNDVAMMVPGMYSLSAGDFLTWGVLVGLKLCVPCLIGHTGPAFWRSKSF